MTSGLPHRAEVTAVTSQRLAASCAPWWKSSLRGSASWSVMWRLDVCNGNLKLQAGRAYLMKQTNVFPQLQETPFPNQCPAPDQAIWDVHEGFRVKGKQQAQVLIEEVTLPPGLPGNGWTPSGLQPLWPSDPNATWQCNSSSGGMRAGSPHGHRAARWWHTCGQTDTRSHSASIDSKIKGLKGLISSKFLTQHPSLSPVGQLLRKLISFAKTNSWKQPFLNVLFFCLFLHWL